MTRLLTLLVFLLFCTGNEGRAATYVYDYNSNCSHAYQCYMAMHIDEGKAAITAELAANPNNLMATFIADYEDCLILLMNCEQKEYDARSAHLDERIDVLEKGDPSSPWRRFCMAGVYLHWAIVATRFGDQYKAAINFHRSFALLKENEAQFPAFEYNHVYAGLQQAVVGALPGNYKWLASLFGMKGDIKKGVEQLTTFISTHNATQPMYTETVLYSLFSRFYLANDQAGVWSYMQSAEFDTHTNLLNAFAKAVIAIDDKKADGAITTLKDAGADVYYNRYPVFDYLMGMALLTGSDNTCINYFTQYLKKNRSELYIKDCWQKMAYSWYLAGNMQEAAYCRLQAKETGTTRLDADKQAEKFATGTTWPLQKLLQARLLTDGGYYDRAFILLKSIGVPELTTAADRAECMYRLGNVYEAKADYKNAIVYYRYAIAVGKERHEQFAARAALHIGIIYERSNRNKEAIAAYNECLDMPAHDFQNSIDQQAKAGMNRLTSE